MHDTRRVLATLAAVATVWIVGCHREVELPPLPETKISVIGDRFFDVKALSAERALVIGYRRQDPRDQRLGSDLERHQDADRSGALQHPFRRRPERLDLRPGRVDPQHQGRRQDLDGAEEQHRAISVRDLRAEPDPRVRRGRQVDPRSRPPTAAPTGRRARSPSRARASPRTSRSRCRTRSSTTSSSRTSSTAGSSASSAPSATTADGGQTWVAQQESLLGEGIVDILDLPTLFGVHFVNTQEGIAAGLEGKIARTNDGGAKWALRYGGREGSPVDDPLYAPFLFPDGKAWVVGAGGEVSRESPARPRGSAPSSACGSSRGSAASTSSTTTTAGSSAASGPS